ncbi:hypothetical protein [Nocardia sp. alder85J]|uniref:hypothetical protein n=1 Tax=Nocardia sp. alder85J TaxID=2862949 RepID=UPI001CD36A49|nr:hypothetical protein [Nocardia sp. alder85J]MCX4096753.1 hypothetical protein [Nocardia sp. alder85J]
MRMKTRIAIVAGLAVIGVPGIASAAPGDAGTGSACAPVMAPQDKPADHGATGADAGVPPRRRSAYETPEGSQEMFDTAVQGSASGL